MGKTHSVGGNAAAGFANPDDDDEDDDETENGDNGSKEISRGGYDNADDVGNSYTQDHCDRDEGSSDEESDDYSNDDSNEESEDDDSGEESDDYDDSDEDDSAEDDDDDSDEDDEIGFVYRVSSGGLLN